MVGHGHRTSRRLTAATRDAHSRARAWSGMYWYRSFHVVHDYFLGGSFLGGGDHSTEVLLCPAQVWWI
jgi:hypothetical protein